MNLIEKMHAVLVSSEVRVWHYHTAQVPSFLWWAMEGGRWVERGSCSSLEELIEAAYAVIDPLRRSLPVAVVPGC